MTSKDRSATGTFSSLRQGSTDAAAVEQYYDDWADSYDATLADWNYHAPEDACALLAPSLNPGARILDVGCGTGLLAKALREYGRYSIDGIDISGASLRHAEARGFYSALIRHDLQDLPLPVADNAYDAAASVGVLTYIEDAEALMRDLCRCVRPGGAILFTQRTDLWEERDFQSMIDRLEEDGLWADPRIGPPLGYLPGNAEFSDDIKVIHTLCRVAGG